MAERLRKKHQEEVRTKIKVSQLINVLHDHAFGVIEDIKPTRMKAIEILLKKALPDLSATEVSGDADAPIGIKVITGIDND